MGEKQLRHDLDEDLRWFKQHNNKKPEKSEFREAARRSRSVLELSRIESGEKDMNITRNFNRYGSCHQPPRPRRLETWGSPTKVWTPRSRPKTPGPWHSRNVLGKEVVVDMPEAYDRDPSNPLAAQLKMHVFGFL